MSEEFISMLEYAKTLPTEYADDYWDDYDYMQYESQYRENRTLLMNLYISRIQDINYSINGYLGEEAAFVGFPGIEGNSSIIQPGSYLYAISENSANKQGAWDFVKYYLSPEYQNIAKNTLGRTLVGKSFYEDEKGKRHSDPPQLEARIINPFVCMPGKNGKGGVIFNYSLFFKNVVERGNTGSELSNAVSFAGSSTISFGTEKLLAVYEKENWVEQTIGLPVLCRIPILKYLFSTTTTTGQEIARNKGRQDKLRDFLIKEGQYEA